MLELLNVARTAAGVAELEGHPDLDLLTRLATSGEPWIFSQNTDLQTL